MPLNNAYKSKSFRSRFWQSAIEIGAVISVFYLWMLSQSVLAADLEEEKSHSTLWLETLEPTTTEEPDDREESQGFSALQLETDVSIHVNGPISRVKVKQVFYNPSPYWVEGQYRYPLPESAAVDHLRMRIGDRVVEGQIQEKKKAAKTFAKARREGKRASLLSHHRSNQFRTQVTNIAPQERVIVEFEYQQWLDFKDGRYDLRFPMVSSPAYTPSIEQGSFATLQQDFVYPDNHFRSHSEAAGNPVRITLDLDAGLPISMPMSESHSVDLKRLDETHYQIELKGLAELSNRDFLLNWRPVLAAQPTLTVLQEALNEDHYGLLMIMPPQEDLLSNHLQARELVLVLDVSGSMQGESIRQAKEALKFALAQLKEEDLFNLIWFNNSADSLFSVSKKATERNLSLALQQVENLEANGGTNMIPALEAALKSAEKETPTSSEQQGPVLRQVVFVTDGAVGNEAELFTMIRQRLGQSRLFTVGIGSAPNSYFMRKAAHAGRGSFTYINKPEFVVDKMSALFDLLASPALTDVNIDFQGYEVELFPKPLPDVYLGEPLYAVFKAERFPEYASVSGKINGQGVYTNHVLQESAEESSISDSQTGIAVEWARRKVDHLLEQYRDSGAENKAAIKQKIVSLALDHHLVSKFTSLVAVDKAPVRSGAELIDQKLPANLPAGWQLGSSQSQNIQLAQTSNGLFFKFTSGLIALILSWIFLQGARRLSSRKRPLTC